MASQDNVSGYVATSGAAVPPAHGQVGLLETAPVAGQSFEGGFGRQLQYPSAGAEVGGESKLGVRWDTSNDVAYPGPAGADTMGQAGYDNQQSNAVIPSTVPNVFLVGGQSEVRDWAKPKHLLAARDDMTVDQAMIAGHTKFYLRWPYPRSIINHRHVKGPTLTFAIKARRLSTLVGKNRRSGTPVIVNIDSKTLARVLESVGRDDALFIPHKIVLKAATNIGVPCATYVQLYSHVGGSGRRPWFALEHIHSSNGGHLDHPDGMGLRLEAGERYVNRRQSPDDEALFLSNSAVVTEAGWCRWAVLSKDRVLAHLRRHHGDADSTVYTFKFNNRFTVDAADPETYMVTRNLDSLVKHAQQLPQFRGYTVERAVRVNADQSVTVTLPRIVVDAMVTNICEKIHRHKYTMRFANMYAAFRLEDSWAELEDRLRSPGSTTIKDPVINISVTIQLQGVWMPTVDMDM